MSLVELFIPVSLAAYCESLNSITLLAGNQAATAPQSPPNAQHAGESCISSADYCKHIYHTLLVANRRNQAATAPQTAPQPPPQSPPQSPSDAHHASNVRSGES